MNIFNSPFNDLGEYERYCARMHPEHNQPSTSSQPDYDQANHADEAHHAHAKNLAPVRNTPEPRHLHKMRPTHERALVPAGNGVDGKLLARPMEALMHRTLVQKDSIYNQVLKARQFGASTSLLRNITQSQPVWSPAQISALNDWKNSGIGSENRNKAVDTLTQFKKNGKTTLDLSELSLKGLPSVMFQLNIKELNISNNSFHTLPPKIGSLTGLVRLNASGNILESVPVEIGGLIRLKHLDLSGNKRLNTLPTTFEGLQGLETLKLDNNCFTEVPTEIEKLNKLSTFSISENLLVLAPDMMNHMQGLRHLNMAKNSIEKISRVWDLLLNKLESLDLSGNNILELPFTGVPKKLKTLDLSNNHLICYLPASFGAIMWAEKGALKTTSRSRGNMRIIVDNTHLIAGLHSQGRLELRDENDLYELPDVLRLSPRGGSRSDSYASEIDLAELGFPPMPPGEIEGMSAVKAPATLKSLKKKERIENWIKNSSAPQK